MKLGYMIMNQNPKGNQCNGTIQRLQNQKSLMHKIQLEKLWLLSYEMPKNLFLLRFCQGEK